MNDPRFKPLVGKWPYVEGATRSFLDPSKRNRSVRRVVLLTSLLRLGLIARGTHLTNMNKFDGGGSQVHQALAVRAFCKAFGVPYAHSPFVRMQHAGGPEEVAAWEHRFNLGQGYPVVGELGLRQISVGRYLLSPALWRKPVVVTNAEVHPFLNANPEAYGPVRMEAIAAYRGNRALRWAGAPSIAVHVRRGDVRPGKRRYTSDDRILSTIDMVLTAASRHRMAPRVTIFSQGEATDFSGYFERGFAVCLNGDPLDAFDAMTSADVLIMAKSSLSYVAALLNQCGIAIYEPWMFAPMPDWYNSNEDGQRLIARLAERLGSSRGGVLDEPRRPL